MSKLCPEHMVPVKLRDGQYGPFYSHKQGEEWCNKKPDEVIEDDTTVSQNLAIKPTSTAPTEETREKVEGPDWDKITRGKVRHGVVIAVIENGGIKALEGNYEAINKVVDYIIDGEIKST